MTTASRPRSTRSRPAKAPLSEAAIVDAALAILKSDGLAAVTMRKVAEALETGPASLYVYVANRDALLEAIQDRITSTIPLEPVDPSRWREQLHDLLERMFRSFAAHPGLAVAAMATPPRNEATYLVLENMLGLLLAGGMTPQDAAWAADILAMLVTHAAIEADVRRPDDELLVREVRSAFAELPAERFPLITAHAKVLTSGTSDARFHFGIDAVLDGLLLREPRG